MKTLVLNAGFEPMSVVSHRRAIILILTGKATILAEYPNAPMRSASVLMESPAVVVLARYVQPPRVRTTALSRRGVLRRDGNRCAYCSAHAGTVDHVVPRSRGGENSWQNLVASCRTCNNRKGDRTLDEIGWTLPFTPAEPRTGGWWLRDVESPVEQWRPFLELRAAA